MLNRFWFAFIFCTLSAVVFSLQVWAEEAVPAAESSVLSNNSDDLSLIFAEEDLFISATQTARTLDQAPAIATVITAKQLKDMGARNIMDALDKVPGFGVTYPTVFSVENTLEVRGMKTAEAEKTLLMIDGHTVNTPFGGSWNVVFDEFPVDQIKRIEVIRGPGSALYGANAFVAVINIIMKKPGELEGAGITAGGGNNETVHGNLVLGHQDGNFRFIGSLDHYDTNGSSRLVARDAIGNSGYTNFWRTNNTGHFIVEYDKFSLTGLWVEKDRGSPIGILNIVDLETRFDVLQAYGELAYSDRFGDVDLDARFSVDQVSSDVLHEFGGLNIGSSEDPVFTANPMFKTRTLSPKIKLSLPIGGHFLTMGMEYNHMRMFDVEHILNGQDVSDSFNHNQEVTREIFAAFIQDEWEIRKGMILTGGVRLDHYSDFGTTVNPRLAFVWGVAKKVDLKLLYGRAFRAPSFLELYEKNNPSAVGNPDLKPEIINTVEAGVTWRITSAYGWYTNLFFNNFTDRIVRQVPQSANQGGADIWGLETEFRADLRGSLYGYVNYAYQDSRDDETGRELPDVPHHRLKAGINWGFFDDKLNTNFGLRWTGERPRVEGDARPPTESNTVVDAALRLERLLKGFDLTLKVHNLFDEDVFDPTENVSPPSPLLTVEEGFPRPGRTWLLEGRYVF